MIVVGLDLETTGLSKVKDRPIEASATLWTTNFSRSLGSTTLLVQSDGVKISAESTEKTGITQSMVDNFGVEPSYAFDVMTHYVSRAEAIVAFNGRRFDIPMYNEWARRLSKKFPEKLVIDPFVDLPMPGQELITMCAKRKIYYNAHEAGADVGAMLTLMSDFDFDVVLERAKSPVVVVRSKQDRSQNDRVKKHKFRWNPERQIWWKAVKEIDLNVLAAKVNNEFGLEVLDLKPEDMETDSDD